MSVTETVKISVHSSIVSKILETKTKIPVIVTKIPVIVLKIPVIVLKIPVIVAPVAVSHGVSDSGAEALSERVAVFHLLVVEHGSCEREVDHRVDVDNKHGKRNDYLISEDNYLG